MGTPPPSLDNIGRPDGHSKENKDEEELEEKAVATLSLSVQVPAGDGKTIGEKGLR